MKEQKYHLYLSDDEYRQTIQSLVRLKNNLIAQGRYTDGVDDVLCKVAEILKEAVENRGVVGRIGGDEFFIVLENVNYENELRSILRTIRMNVEWAYKHKLKSE